jgi:hypothetical protein
VLKRLRPPDYAAGLFGLLLLSSLFAPWYTITDGTSDGWRSLGLIDIWLLITALLAMLIPLVTAAKDAPAVPIALNVVTAWIAFFAFWLTLYRVISIANDQFATGREWGLWFALISVIGTFASVWWAMRTEDAPALRPPPPVRAMPVPPVEDPATPPT